MRLVTQHQWQGRLLVPLAGVPCLVTINTPILYKDGKEYRFIQGPTWMERDDENHINLICIGTYAEQGNHITLPASSILAIVECSKVLKRDDILVLV